MRGKTSIAYVKGCIIRAVFSLQLKGHTSLYFKLLTQVSSRDLTGI